MKNILSDKEISAAFTNTNFGNRSHRKLLEQGVLKQLAGYRSGSTLTAIIINLKLISKKNKNVLSKGKRFLMESFYDAKQTG